ncbi:MAG: CoA transferase [Sphingomonadaceae bacterium]|nr:CoA transferase [Sphingomonadaceae bacterium]
MISPADGEAMLQGLKVVDLTSVVFGPYCTQILADFGADVTKVESPGGDAFRHAGKPAATKGMGPAFLALNRGKKSATLNLKDETDRALMAEMLRDADIFIHNVRGEAIARLGFDYDSVKALNPTIIYVHCVGFGSNGPYAGLPAYDDVIQAASGATTLMGRVDGNPRPRYIPSLIADKVAGLHAAYATMAAVIHRLRTGEGQHVEVPMFEAFSSFTLKEHLFGLTFDPPIGTEGYSRQLDPNRQPFQTRDGWVSIAAYNLNDFVTIITALGDPEFLDDERFATPLGIFQNSAILYRRIAELLPAFTTAEAIELMRKHSLPAMPVRDLSAMLEDPHLQQAGFFQQREHPSEGTLNEMREPSRFSAWQGHETRPVPRLGEHTDELRDQSGS